MVTKSSMLAAACLLLFFQLYPERSAHAGGFWSWNCESGSLVDIWTSEIEGSELSGRGNVCATPLGLWSTMRVTGLTPGNAYTVWWIYIDDPDSCANFPLTTENAPIPFDEPVGYAGRCGFADFFTPDESGEFLNPLVVFGRMDSVVAGTRPATRFAGDLRSFDPSPGSQVWMLIFGHGPAADDKRQLARQLLTPEDPGSGVPHLGIEGRPFGFPAGVVVIEVP